MKSGKKSQTKHKREKILTKIKNLKYITTNHIRAQVTSIPDSSPAQKNKLPWSICISTVIEKEQGKKNSQGNYKLRASNFVDYCHLLYGCWHREASRANFNPEFSSCINEGLWASRYWIQYNLKIKFGTSESKMSCINAGVSNVGRHT